MTELVVVAVSVLVAMAGSELVLRGAKLQTGLTRVLALWAVVYLIAIVWFVRAGDAAVLAFTTFWGGVFLLWFGVRSHLESSILLRMLVLLRNRSMSDGRLLDEYAALYGEPMRVAELSRAGMIRDGMRVTPKGKAVLFVASKLR
jgi:hypothetical protein